MSGSRSTPSRPRPTNTTTTTTTSPGSPVPSDPPDATSTGVSDSERPPSFVDDNDFDWLSRAELTAPLSPGNQTCEPTAEDSGLDMRSSDEDRDDLRQSESPIPDVRPFEKAGFFDREQELLPFEREPPAPEGSSRVFKESYKLRSPSPWSRGSESGAEADGKTRRMSRRRIRERAKARGRLSVGSSGGDATSSHDG